MIAQLDNLDRPGVSIVICTFNGSHRIVPTLQHVARQRIADVACELIIVDNNSVDHTAEKAAEVWESFQSPFPLRIIHEPQAGTMHARFRGIRESHFRYLLYCDDDNWLGEGFIETAFDLIRSDSTIAAVGAMGIMHYDEGFVPPAWIKPYEKNYGTGPQGNTDGDTTYVKMCLYTAGAIIDRQWLNKLYQMGFESSLSGRDGKSLMAGEDTELTFALKLIGGKLYYSSKMRFFHYMPSGRVNWIYLKKLWHSFGYSDFILSPYSDLYLSIKPRSFVVKLIKVLKDIGYVYLQIRYHNFGEGNKYVLKLERLKGELKGMIYYYPKYRGNVHMLKRLREHGDVNEGS